ncbi:MAG: ABC transporter substrate-binding protein [Firmicutes bacterium]|nr:ABC transporter substrate-binding protein [Bacillota bacterium]
MRKITEVIAALILAVCLAACGDISESKIQIDSETLVYGSGDYTRINPAMDEHGEINTLIFDGLTRHDGNNKVIPALAENWNFDENTNTYTFNLRENVKWHDGEFLTAEDVKFTIESIMDVKNRSENAPDYEDIEEIVVIDSHTISFVLDSPNAAFLNYMTMAVLPQHLLEGEDMQTSDFFLNPVGTGPYMLDSWEKGQAITLKKNDTYYMGEPNIDTVIFKIVPDDSVRAMQLRSGELDLAILTPKDAKTFEGTEGFVNYHMETSDYRGIMFNFNNEYWQKNKDIIPAVCCSIDRDAIVDTVLLGRGEAAYGPLQRNVYNNENVDHYDYDPQRAQSILQTAGCEKREDGFYYRNGKKIGFIISVGAGDQVRADIAQIAAQQLKKTGIDVTVEIVAQADWKEQMAYLIGWGSPFDADSHTYKVFGTHKGANYSGYSNESVDFYLKEARRNADSKARADAYGKFQQALSDNPAYTFICYVDADYVAVRGIEGISENTVMGHHGVGIFWNITDWEIER